MRRSAVASSRAVAVICLALAAAAGCGSVTIKGSDAAGSDADAHGSADAADAAAHADAAGSEADAHGSADAADAADIAVDLASTSDAGDGGPSLGSPCRAGDTCGGPPLGCAYGLSGSGTCAHCGDANQVCCNSTGLATGTCNGGLTCQQAVDTARHCSSS